MTMMHSRHYQSVRRLVNRSIARRNTNNPAPCRCASSSTSIGGMTIYNSLSSNYQKLYPPHHTHHITDSTTSPTLGTAWYVCGPTVYDSAHLGHGRTYVSLDILRRVALSLHDESSTTQPRPIYVMNITDVDDKIIQRSMEIGAKSSKGDEEPLSNPLALARYYEMEFWQDLDALNVLRPDVVCRVSEHVEQTIVPYIEMILEGGMAYVIPEENEDVDGDSERLRGSVYFDVRAFEDVTKGRTKYGKLAPDSASSDFFSWEETKSNGSSDNSSNNHGNIINNDEGESLSQIRQKRDPRDFCLWKYRTQSPPSSSKVATDSSPPMIEPAIVSYSSPWGPGRPGWHVECSAMIQRLSMDFQSTHKFQLHAGGIDLKFPHHSNEIAQAEAFHEAVAEKAKDGEGGRKFEEWIPNWLHTGHLYVKGRKMSKSLKNFVTIREMLGTSNNTSDKEEGEETDSHQNEQSAWSCPSDDFRLWCLGLSGSYRGPATYSKDRMDEACVIRTKWIKFLMEGQQCLDECKRAENVCHSYATDDSASQQSTKVWGKDELQLFKEVTQSGRKCREALVGRCATNTDGSTRGSFDLDGASFVKELTKLANLGLAYVHGTSIDKPRPEEPLRFALDTFRRQLDLVGFSSYTVNAGISTLEHTSPSDADLLDEIAAFRRAIRAATLNGIRSKDTLSAAKDVLGLCDELRDDILPSLGVELVDGKAANEVDNNRAWRRCSPRDSHDSQKMSSGKEV